MDALGVSTRALQSAMENIDAENYAVAIDELNTAKATLVRAREYEWPDGYYYRCIYEGGDGSAYESGWYKKANTANALTAIDDLISECQSRASE